MTNRMMLGIFIVVCVAQLLAPVSMIYTHEATLASGKLFKFKTAPVDPADVFRGKYVALRFEDQEGHGETGVDWASLDEVYALVEEATDGYAHFTEVLLAPPEDLDYLRVKVSHTQGSRLSLNIPFDRYYLPEDLAPQAEQAYREHSRMGNRDAYVTVVIKDGFGVISNLYLSGQPILEFLRSQNNPEPTAIP